MCQDRLTNSVTIYSFMNKRWTKELKLTHKHEVIVTNVMSAITRSAVSHDTIMLHSEAYLKHSVRFIFLVYTVLFLKSSSDLFCCLCSLIEIVGTFKLLKPPVSVPQNLICTFKNVVPSP